MRSSMTASSTDFIALFAYAALTLWIGHRVAKNEGADDFLLAGRSLGLPLFVGSLVSTWYGAIFGVTEIAFKHGLASWLTQGIFWYGAYLIFAFFLASRLAQSGHRTLPEQIGALHGENARFFAAILNYFNVVPIAYMLVLGKLAEVLFSWPVWLGILVFGAIAALYSAAGGFKAVIYTDLLQFLLMCLGVAAMIVYAVTRLGGADFLQNRLPADHLSLLGNMSVQEIVVWAVVALSTLVDPNFYHRCFAAASPRIARNGILIAIFFWVLFDVCTTFGGLYARAALPFWNPSSAYAVLGGLILPAGLESLFWVAILASAMSTIDSYCFVGAMTISVDLFPPSKETTDRDLVRKTRAGVFLTAALAAVLAMIFSGSFKAIWKTLGSLSAAAMMLPAALGLLGWRPPGAGFAAMVGGASGTLGWAALRAMSIPWALKLEALMPGVSLSLCCYIIVGLVPERKARE
jgi:SSS family solute:Na+ symporter